MSENTRTPSAVKTALAALKKHPEWCFFPLPPRRKAPPPTNMLNDGVRPPGATNNRTVIEQWDSTVNVGIAPHASRLTFMDVDVKPGKRGEETLAALIAKHGPLPKTYTVKTPSGGLHYWFGETFVVQHRFGVGAFGPDVDCPQYVLIPGSVVDGSGYTVIDNSPVADAPDWFADYLTERPNAAAATGHNDAPAVELDLPENIERAIFYLRKDSPRSVMGQNGERTVLLVAAVLKDLGISKETTIELMAENYNVEGKCDPLWSFFEGPIEDRMDAKIANAWAYLKGTQPGALGITPGMDFGDDDLSDFDPATHAPTQSALEAIPAWRERLAVKTEGFTFRRRRLWRRN